MKGITWLLVVSACSSSNGKQPADAAPDTPLIDDAPPQAPMPIYPVAPTASEFMWPSLQERFHHADGTTCTGRVTLAVGDQAVCYVATGGELRCAGSIYTHAYGSSFVPIGETNVDAVTISGTANSATGNSICIHKTDHTLSCMGANTTFGALGTGDTNPTATFYQWPIPDLVRMIDLVDTMCALDGAGEIWCAGDNHTPSPTSASSAGHHSMYIDEFGTLQIDSTSVVRASDGYTCQIESDGMHCNAPMTQVLSGTPGDVVNGVVIAAPGGPAMGDYPACTLDSHGVVRCSVSGITAQLFMAAPPILAIAGTFYGDTLCAAANDGSLWCKGTNAHGELGTGNTMAVTTEAQVQPPGSIDVTCL